LCLPGLGSVWAHLCRSPFLVACLTCTPSGTLFLSSFPERGAVALPPDRNFFLSPEIHSSGSLDPMRLGSAISLFPFGGFDIFQDDFLKPACEVAPSTPRKSSNRSSVPCRSIRGNGGPSAIFFFSPRQGFPELFSPERKRRAPQTKKGYPPILLAYGVIFKDPP